MAIATRFEQPPEVARSAVMKAAVFHRPGDIRVKQVPRPKAGPGEAVIRITLTTICGIHA